MPCAVCRLSGLTCVDHIIPVTKGGGRERSNLQPLCLQCNTKKSNRMTNEELRAWVAQRSEEHLLKHQYYLATRYIWPRFDRPSFYEWQRARQGDKRA